MYDAYTHLQFLSPSFSLIKQILHLSWMITVS